MLTIGKNTRPRPKVGRVTVKGKNYLDVTDSYTSYYTYAAMYIPLFGMYDDESQDELSV